jgi:hypothetical protein
LKKAKRYDVSGLVEAQFEPGSRGQVLKNLVGIKSKREMDVAEAKALKRAVDELVRTYDKDHRHPFREGNGRLARVLATLMATQADLPLLNFEMIQGRKKLEYFKAVREGFNRNYRPMEEIFTWVIDRTFSTYPK